MLQQLEDLRLGIRLLNVRQQGEEANPTTVATVYVPRSKRGHFMRKIDTYAEEETAGGSPKNKRLVESISDIRDSVLESFWQDDPHLIPGSSPSWVEVWLSSDKEDILNRFNSLLAQQSLEPAGGVLFFPERTVATIRANRGQLETLIKLSDDIAEMRAPKDVATPFIELENSEQLALVMTLRDRTRVDDSTTVAVCILDTGANRQHLLLQPVLSPEDCHSVDPSWGVSDDNRGHGTRMAGLAAYGDLVDVLQADSPIWLTHRLESSKILPPPPGQNDAKIWGMRTAQGISYAEIQAPDRQRIVCLAVGSSEARDRGRPSSWSAELDKLASGADDGKRRLIVVAAGNVDNENGDEFRSYPDSNCTSEVHDPAQAWNALVVGAYTEKASLRDRTLNGFACVAPARGLSPYSTTSLAWDQKWPLKPDVLFEGGNVSRGPNDSIFVPDDLELLSTSHDPTRAQFASFRATSAAAALAARMAARIQREYPEAWPETVRALLVHSANWTEPMLQRFLVDSSRTAYRGLLRICGYGVPDYGRAIRCTQNSLTLVSQAELQPFDKSGDRYVTRDMHLYDLPWPEEVLLGLGAMGVEMRVTLSYFVEPGPGERGWQDRYRYSSFGLRFDVNSPSESKADFLRRVNVQAREDGTAPGTASPREKWVVGSETRSAGSIHSDIWRGSAAELATSHYLAVYPTVGWWRERHYLGRWNRTCRYSLIVSIHTPAATVDVYTPVAIQIGVSTPVEISTL